MNNRNEYTMNYTLSTPVTVLKGVGEARGTSLLSMGIETLGDLVRCFPRAYQNRGDTVLNLGYKRKAISRGKRYFFTDTDYSFRAERENDTPRNDRYEVQCV